MYADEQREMTVCEYCSFTIYPGVPEHWPIGAVEWRRDNHTIVKWTRGHPVNSTRYSITIRTDERGN